MKFVVPLICQPSYECRSQGGGDSVEKGWIVPVLEGFPGESLMNINMVPSSLPCPTRIPVSCANKFLHTLI